MPNNTPQRFAVPKARVSILERVLPYAAAAICLMVAPVTSLYIKQLIDTLAKAESAGTAAVAGGMAGSLSISAALLGIGIVFAMAGVIVSVIRSFLDSATPSPSGIGYIVAAVFALAPAAGVWYVGSLVIDWLDPTSIKNAEQVRPQIDTILLGSSLVSVLGLMLLLVLTFAPFKAAPGKRFGPVAASAFMLISFCVALALFIYRIFEFVAIRDMN